MMMRSLVSSRIGAVTFVSAILLFAGAAHALAPAAVEPFILSLPYVPAAHLPGAVVRTAEAMETWIAEDLVKRSAGRTELVQHDAAQAISALQSGEADLALLPMADADEAAAAGLTVVPTRYRTGAMAIMRNDTDIRRWRDLRNRTVCVAQGGHYVGTLSSSYGAIEQVYPSAAEALIKVREGACDAAVSDNQLLEEILRMPEWKKFSARLPAQETAPLVLLAATDNAMAVQTAHELARQWNGRGQSREVLKKKAYDIAFEVYLGQEAVDCH